MNSITIFTDGSSRGNPGPGGWGAVVVDNETVVELGGREDGTTNNKMELTAAIKALENVQEKLEKNRSGLVESTNDEGLKSLVSIYTDSRYVINGITKWVFGWQKNGWITSTKEEVLNKELWVRLASLTKGLKIEWNYVGGHKGILGNERCDEIATLFADKKDVSLYDGSRKNYPIDILNFKIDEKKAALTSASKKRSGAKAYSYLSLIDGKAERHATWTECEARVKGKSGARFKKALNAEEEKEILNEWGVSL